MQTNPTLEGGEGILQAAALVNVSPEPALAASEPASLALQPYQGKPFGHSQC